MARRKTSKKRGLTLPDFVDILKNPKFCAAATEFHSHAVTWVKSVPTRKEWEQKWPEFERKYVLPFLSKWGVVPPPHREVFEDLDPRWEPSFAILTGQWGVIPVFPWTTVEDIKHQRKQIKEATGKVHKDTKEQRRLALIADWMELHLAEGEKPPPRREIASVVWGRKTDLRRPSKANAVRRFRISGEEELIRRYKEKMGMTHLQAEKRFYRRARGTEAKAAAAVRMAVKRQEEAREEFMRRLQSPKQTDPLGYALTLLLREIFEGPGDIEAIRQTAASLRDLLITPPNQD
jgi:hypothetical protein